MYRGTFDKSKTAILCASEIGGIAATMKLAPKGKRWPIVTAILVGGELFGYAFTRHNVKKHVKKYGCKLVKYSIIDHVKTIANGELPEECFELDS